MNTSDKILLLNNINFVITTTIIIMSVFIYYLKRELHYICFAMVYFIESILFINLAVNGLFNNYGISLGYLFVIKILCLVINRNSLESNSFKKILLIVINSTGLFLISYSTMISLVLDIAVNLITLYIYGYKIFAKVNNEFSYIKVKAKMNEGYIQSLIKEIQSEVDNNDKLDKKEEQLNNIFYISLSKCKFPILILENNIVKYTNNKFNKLFKERDFDKLHVESFFRKSFYNPKEIIDIINSQERVLDMNINSIKGQAYLLNAVELINQNKKFKVVQFCNLKSTYKEKEKITFNENSYKKLIEVMDDGILIINKDKIDYISSKVKDILSIKDKIYSIEDLLPYISIVERDKFIKNISSNKLNKENSIWYTKTYKNKSLKVSQSLLNIDNKELKLIIFSDITQSQQLMEDIEERETIYRVLLETLPDGIVIMDKTTQKYIYKNKYMIEQFKKIGIDKFNNIVDEYLHSVDFDNEKIINLNKKENASIVITDIKSENVYIIVFKILENNQKIQDIRERLKKTQQTEEFKTQFCIDVVDKIENPVDNMLYENTIMKKNVNSQIIKNHVDLVRKNLYRLKKVLDNINDIMDIENLSYDLNYVVFDVVKLLKDISILSKYYIDRKYLNLELEFSDDEILVYLDSVKLQKIILNILSNAIKFTDKSGKIKISVEKKIDFIVISIKDSGIGIPKDQMNFIFENFEQIDRGLSRLAEGMGMGLYLVKQLAEIQDLYLNVDSELNKGSEFKILIRNTENSFLKNKYKKDICIKKEFVDIQFADIYPA